MKSRHQNGTPEWFHDKAQVVLVVEMPVETQTMELVVCVGIVQPFQELQLLQAGLVPAIAYK